MGRRKAGSAKRFGRVPREWSQTGSMGPCKEFATGMGMRLENFKCRTQRTAKIAEPHFLLKIGLHTLGPHLSFTWHAWLVSLPVVVCRGETFLIFLTHFAPCLVGAILYFPKAVLYELIVFWGFQFCPGSHVECVPYCFHRAMSLQDGCYKILLLPPMYPWQLCHIAFQN